MRRLDLACMLLSATVFGGSLAAQQKQYVFVENSRGGDVSIMDDATFTVVGTIPVGLSPDDIVPSRDGKTLYLTRIIRRPQGQAAAAGQALGELVAIDPKARTVLWRTNVTGTPNHLMASPDGRYVYVTIVSTNHVDVVDIAKRAVVDSVVVGTGPHDIEIAPDGKRGYVGLIRGHGVTAFDATTRKAIKTVDMPQNVRPIAVTHDERTMYLQMSYVHGFAVLDLESGKTVRTVQIPMPAGRSLPDSMPNTANHGLRITPDGKTLLANSSILNQVTFYSLPDLQVLGAVPVGDDPNWITLTPDGKHAYVSARASDEVSVVDIATRKELARIKVGKYPQRMASVVIAGG